MTMAVITVSRQAGSEGDHIAGLVASMLGYKFVDRGTLISEAQKRGLVEPEFAHEIRSGGLRYFCTWDAYIASPGRLVRRGEVASFLPEFES